MFWSGNVRAVSSPIQQCLCLGGGGRVGGGVVREREWGRVGHVQEEPGPGSWKIMKVSPA